MAVDFTIGGVAHNAFDIDADGIYLFIAVRNGSNKPQIIKLLANLSEDGNIVFNPGAGSEVNLMAGDLSAYWIWATGNFGGSDKVVQTTDGGAFWYVQNESDWVGTARPILVGPGDDNLLTTSTGTSFWQNRYDGDVIYWIERYLPGDAWAVDRVDVSLDEVALGAYWYSGDSNLVTHYSPNSGFHWKSITDGLPAATVTSILIGR